MQEQEKRQRGSGSIFHNGSNVWWIKFYVRGIPRRESSHSTDRKVAERLLKHRLAAVEMNIPVIRTNVRIDELIADLLAEYRRERRKSTSYVEMRWKQHMQPFFTRMKADDLNTDMVQRYCAKREAEGVCGPTINRELAILKRAYYLALRRTPAKVRSCPVIPMYAENDARTGFLEEADYIQLRQECSKVEGLWLRTLVTVAYNFAWRKGELLNLRVRQVDLASRTIRLDVGTTKNGDAREVSMTDEVLTLLTACITGKQNDDFVFTRSDGKPVKSFRKVWSTVCEKAGVPELLFHDLRRSGVRNLVRLGVKETVAMEISGHKTRSVFDRYNITSKKDLADAAELLNKKQKSIAPLLEQAAISLGQGSGSLAREVVQNANLALPLAPAPTALSN